MLSLKNMAILKYHIHKLAAVQSHVKYLRKKTTKETRLQLKHPAPSNKDGHIESFEETKNVLVI